MLKATGNPLQSLHLLLLLKTPRQQLKQSKVKPKVSLRLFVRKPKQRLIFQNCFWYEKQTKIIEII
jgi:hypothetical protein